MITSPKFRQRLVVMVKEPRPGRVKTRIGASLGMTTAAWWFRHQSQKLLRELKDPRWDLILAVTPDYEGLRSRVWPSHIALLAQGQGSLGERMKNIFQSLPPGPTCIIGADIPGITRSHILEAFQSLGSHQATFGPAEDGGYWLIGLKRLRPAPHGIFEGVRWSSATTLQDTKDSLKDLSITEVATLKDFDEAADLI